MKLRLIPLSVALCLGLASAAQAADHEVRMLDSGADGSMVFEPGYLKVAPGDTVRFVPAGMAHNSASAFVPDGAEAWKGPMDKPFSVTLDAEGVYLYQCDPHLPLGMVGVIQVGDAVNAEDAAAAAEALKANIAMGKERLDKYLGQVD
ncbi:pseudoazurin [Alkalilimnicola sp. S0819]|uniref:pseudoazurin n=1 Tax=Alkalilimnicola sp. S0819 TaxID=2613922 RepID=UPI001262A451|nr:pseudoazurin [Alkalilimnicola sp. S0819]KAB7623909.1 pseudoazurin [Alkalilimnicola sp. S0819]MPQ16504.1 pseudoazurin [Alkalilimnicola sp. S0819]